LIKDPERLFSLKSNIKKPRSFTTVVKETNDIYLSVLKKKGNAAFTMEGFLS
jgi:hypothetical protein